MSILNFQNVAMYFADREVFSRVTFSVEKGNKIGLIGANGCGKTTLFGLITGALEPTEGKIFMSSGLRIGHVEQHACRDSTLTVYEELLTVFQSLMELEHKLEEIHRKVELTNGRVTEYLEQQNALNEAFVSAGGLTYVSRAHAALAGLGFSKEEENLPVSALSGGQRTKLSLAKLLLSEPELMLLDEPTNHLDIVSCEWLEDFLQKFSGALIVISHDRYFLDKVTSKTMEITAKKLFDGKGCYSEYMKTKALRLETERREYEKGMLEIKRIEKMIEQQKQFNQERNYITIASKEKQIERIRATLPEIPPKAHAFKLRFADVQRSGDEVLYAEGLTKAYEDKTLYENVSFQLYRGDRVFLLGPNGCGKSTLLSMLMGKIPVESGYCHFGVNVRVGYFEQTQASLMHDRSILEEIYAAFPRYTVPEIRTMLGAFNFRGEEIEKNMRSLSGGERARVALLKLILQKPNFLILDEPTNHLDAASREVLEGALAEYEGTLLCVSHDRYFVNRLAQKVLYFSGTSVKALDGNYDSYIAFLRGASAQPAHENTEKKPNAWLQKKEQERNERKRQSRIRKIEERLSEIAKEKDAVSAELSAPETARDYEKIIELTSRIQALDEEESALENEWLSLSE